MNIRLTAVFIIFAIILVIGAALPPASSKPSPKSVALTTVPTAAPATTIKLLQPAASPTPCETATFTGTFTQGQTPDAATQQAWTDFLASLNPSDYETVTISGTFDPIGRILSDPIIVPQIATAMKNRTGGNWTVNGITWTV